MTLAAVVAILAALVLVGVPVRWFLNPITWPFRALRKLRTA